MSDPETDIETGDYIIDADSSRLGFTVRHAMVTRVRGRFGEFTGEGRVDTADPSSSSVRLRITAASLSTGSSDRDSWLQSVDFFGSGTDPEITFDSTEVERAGSTWTITGDLAIKGTTRSVAIPFEETGSTLDSHDSLQVAFVGGSTISRSDWGLNFNAALETGGLLVAQKVVLDFEVVAIRKS